MTYKPQTSITAWLLVMPAVALLGLFTHVPIVGSILHSFYSTDRPRRPSRFVGFDQYDAMFEDPIFWKALTNNLIYALGSVPFSIAIAPAFVFALLVLVAILSSSSLPPSPDTHRPFSSVGTRGRASAQKHAF